MVDHNPTSTGYGGGLRYNFTAEEREQVAYWHIKHGTTLRQLRDRFLVRENRLRIWIKQLKAKLAANPNQPLPPHLNF